MSRFIDSFKCVPVLLFRVSSGKTVKLREFSLKRTKSFDVIPEKGMVKPKALEPSTYEGPNGASMRPLGKFQNELVQSYKGDKVVVYAVPEGTQLPKDLILVHEHSDHYSLQPAVEMPLNKLNEKINKFYAKYAKEYTKSKWLKTFQDTGPPEPSVDLSSSSANSGPNDWIWSDEHGAYYTYDAQGKLEWSPASGPSDSSADPSSSSAGPSSSSADSGTDWVWSQQFRAYYRYNAKGECEWAPTSG
ncbi:hypothetical protein CTA2_10756 [Colletotrichum tanaceti]|uniref:Tse2 ADP-ribosyltransferase toxin domain-containing protein n=1 Tax=Colletotrichum tanaceti TaxID=1306861 RepID=A0A4U6X0B6_9PEZI|nr:hypothetical protein CTA2_10756 [Colletotrichum tanaceti]TKW48780.1 hypothetical protein CTA1_10334 [Colletotrichum tanaceti]